MHFPFKSKDQEAAEDASEPYASTSAPPAYKASVAGQYSCISIVSNDKLRLIRFDEAMINAIRTAIQTSWPNGIQKEEPCETGHEVKLKGRPWESQSVESRSMMLAILKLLHESGYTMQAATNVSRSPFDKPMLFFRFDQIIPAPANWFAIVFSSGDVMKLVQAPGDLVPQIRSLLGDTIKREQVKEENSYQFELKGNPFNAWRTSHRIHASNLLPDLLNLLSTNGYELHATINQNTGAADSAGGIVVSECDSWYMRSR